MGRRINLITSSTSNPTLETQMNTSNPECNNGSHISHSSTPIETMSASFSPSIASSEASGPPSPTKGDIRNFGEFSPGIYRSSFPGPCNIEHLQSLKLKTMITLVTTPYEPEVEEWIASSGIAHYCINITAHKTSNDKISIEEVAKVMTLLNDETKRPVLIHCNKGRHRTGCMVAVYCKLRGIDEDKVVADYHEFAQPKARTLDVAFIRGLRNGDVWDAMNRLEDLVVPISQSRHSNGLMRQNAPTSDDGLSITENGPNSDRKQAPVNIRRVVMGPEPPLSPPSTLACKGSGFSMQELVDALCRISEGRSRDTPTPPATPP